MSRNPDILPERSGETDEERRLRESLNRHAMAFMTALDSAIALRSAPGDAARARHQSRGHLQDACLTAMHAHQLSSHQRKA